ncbi:sigma-54 dependent transcriptional regulator [Persicobacter sp. CCB-QB2]|uniref:sigma-54-dependent transcriptional regulator n=1 Tax=Persicobacter sp. CCB-QB2 TaxID=1561025 RepID=UPI0006A9AE5E|nr:sigma-54 dependent transcriptional regulator [Persicobacter sp. CCB-QB2]
MKIFIVEDNDWYANFLCHHLSRNPEFEVQHFATGKQLISHLEELPDVISLDYELPDLDGDNLLKKIQSFDEELPVIMVSGQEDVNTAIEILKAGAFDYIVKNEDAPERLWQAMHRVQKQQKLLKEVKNLRKEVVKQYHFKNQMIGESPALKACYAMVEKAIQTEITVMINGETGTGKEVLAKAIHYNSKRKQKPFIAVNIASIPENLLESELFGHEKGAFTDAQKRHIGKFEEAQGGTLFLDEIGELPLPAQAKLLRVLQEKEVVRVGGNEIVKLNVRIITATHRNLKNAVKEGAFRKDLFYRLWGLPIVLPPLRERGHDVILLAQHFINTFSKDNHLGEKTLSPLAKKKLLSYNFPGNIRELRSAIELATVLSHGNCIEADDLTFAELEEFPELMEEKMTLKKYIQKILQHHLDNNEGNVITTARELDIGKSTIYNMLKSGELK